MQANDANTQTANSIQAALRTLAEQPDLHIDTHAAELRHQQRSPISQIMACGPCLSHQTTHSHQQYDLARWRGFSVSHDEANSRLSLQNSAQAISQHLSSNHPLSDKERETLSELACLQPLQPQHQARLARVEQDTQLLSPHGEISDLPQLRQLQSTGLSRATALQALGSDNANVLSPAQSTHLLRATVRTKQAVLLHINLPGLTLCQQVYIHSVRHHDEGLTLQGDGWSLTLNAAYLPAQWLLTKRLGHGHVGAIEWLNAHRQAIVTLVHLKAAKHPADLRWQQSLASHTPL